MALGLRIATTRLRLSIDEIHLALPACLLSSALPALNDMGALLGPSPMLGRE